MHPEYRGEVNRSVSAPGKLFLSGEYSVLWGGAALIAAVAPRMSGAVRTRSDGEISLVTAAGRLRGRSTPLGANWGGPVPAPFLFAARGVDEALRAHGRESLGFELVLALTRRSSVGEKLGMGGSAQAALIAVELSRFALEDSFDPLKVALLAHAKAQDGAGSGGDVAAVFAGGIVRYRRYPIEPLAKASALGLLSSALSSAPPVELRRLPPTQFRLSYAYSGESSSTAALISNVEGRLGAADRERFRSESDQLVRALEESILRNDFRSLRQAVSSLQELLSSLGPLETESIHRIVAIARSYGAAAKISGAGGGDGCILFSPDEETEREMLAGLRTRGFWVTTLAVEAGMRGEAEMPPDARALVEE